MPRQRNRGGNRRNTQTVQPTAIEQLPIECWVSIFEFLDMKEMKRISCWISPQVSQNLLESEYNQIFYRRLCEEQLKNDLNQVINTIQSTKRVQARRRERSWGWRNDRRSRRAEFTSAPLPSISSMKELREYLRVCVLKSKWLFSNWYSEDVSLDNRIYESLKFSYTLNIHEPCRLIALQEHLAVENIKKVGEMKAKAFMQEIQQEVVKQSRRPVKWKSIWNGHFIWSTHSNLKYTTREFENRLLHYSTMSSMDVFSYLQTTYNGLMALKPEIRRNEMFKMVTFTYKLNSQKVMEQSFFSKLVSNVFHSGCEMDISLQNLYEKLIYLFVEDSIVYGVKTPILLDVVNAASSTTCISSSNCTLREWLVKLQEETYSFECTLAQLEKSTALLSKVNYSSTSARQSQITKLKKTIATLKGEIEIINLTCSTFYGPDCNLTTPECNSKCLTCASPNTCSNCTGNWDGPTCSICKTGWNGTDCNIPVCDSKCTSCGSPGQCTTCYGNWNGSSCSNCKTGWNGTLCNIPVCDSKCINCTLPGVCSNCSGNWDSPTCSTCKSGWNGSLCNIPVCDTKCINCISPGICSNCTGNWNGTTCSLCKSGWNGTLCNIPICDSKCISCASPGQCTNCTENWYGTTCSGCKTGWNGTLCNIPICDTKCTTCSLPGVCNNCTGNWNGTTCSVCKTGWTGTDCNTPICGSNCASCSAPNVCPTCKSGWYGSDCTSNTPLPILTSTQINKFTSSIMPTAQLISTKLLFKGARDGFLSSSFHSKCDGKGPTIVIIKATSGAIFGGYTAASWASTQTYATDSSAFLFSLVSSTKEERFVRLPLKSGVSSAIFNSGSYGPTFGGGWDIYIADNSNLAAVSVSQLCHSYCDATMTYSSSATSVSNTYLAGSYQFQVEDYEVYSL